MVGASLALGLAYAGFKILVIENRPLSELYPQDDYGLRVSAFTPSSTQWLKHLNVWDNIGLSGRSCPFLHMHVWDSAGSGKLKFNVPKHADSLGSIVDNAVVQGALLDGIFALSQETHPNITVWENTHLTAFHHLENQSLELSAELVFDPNKKSSKKSANESASNAVTSIQSKLIQCDLLIGADGGNSKVRDWAGISCIGWTYGQKTIVGQVKTSKFHEHTCWQRFLENGPIALLPLADGRCSLAWHTTHAEADQLLGLSKLEFEQRLEDAFAGRFGKITITGELDSKAHWGAYPLRLNHAKKYAKKNMVIVGDAAHNIHPLAGLGVNLGFMDAATLLEELINARGKGEFLGDLHVLQRYERRRYAHNILIMGAMDMFKRSSTVQNPVFQFTRNLGLTIADKLPPFKNTLAKVAMGYYGDLPQFMRQS